MRKSRITEGSCNRCGSLKHTLEEHNERMAEGRRKSVLWRQRMLEGNAKKRGKPLIFSDPEARAQRISESLKASPILGLRIAESWIRLSPKQRHERGAKIAEAQRGKKFDLEHLASLRLANSQPRSEEHRRKLGEARLGIEPWNKGLTKFTNASVMSTSLKQMGRVPDYNKYRAHYEGPQGKILMRSRWEVAYAEYLDKQGINWKYEPRFFVIGGGDYTGNSYTPDFLLPSGEWIEIKGRMTVENQNKIDRFRERYPQERLTILGKPELCELGIMDKHGRLGR